MPGEKALLQDAEFFGQFYERTHLLVYRFIYGLGAGPVEEVEDLTAETFLRAWNARRRFHGDERAATGWLLRIARNLVIDSHRRRLVRGPEHALEDLPVESFEPWLEQQILDREKLRILLHLLEDLPVDRREMIVLRYFLDWQVKRIAEYLGIPENTVSVYLRRTLSALQHSWPGNREQE